MPVTLKDAMKIRVRPLPLARRWRTFLGDVPRDLGWSMLIYGCSFGGKSSFALKFAQELAYHGAVLYINAEEDTGKGTLQRKARTLNVYSNNIVFSDTKKLEKVKELLDTGLYKFVFLDSLSAMAHSRAELLEIFSLKDLYPKVSFIYILHFDKSEKVYIGPSTLKHDVDIALSVNNKKTDKIKLATTDKNRYKNTMDNLDFNIFQRN